MQIGVSIRWAEALSRSALFSAASPRRPDTGDITRADEPGLARTLFSEAEGKRN